MSFTSASPVTGLVGSINLFTPTVTDFSFPQTNSTVVVWPFGFTVVSNAAVATVRLIGVAELVTVAGKPGATGVSNDITVE
jgi:hypothetical protein